MSPVGVVLQFLINGGLLAGIELLRRRVMKLEARLKQQERRNK